MTQNADTWFGWVREVPGVNCQAGSRAELIETLRVTLKEALADQRADSDPTEVPTQEIVPIIL